MPNHVTLDQSKPLGNQGRALAASLAAFRAQLATFRGAAKEYLGGDGSADAHYAAFVTAGFGADTVEAHRGYAQVDNLLTAFGTNASQASVLDKLDQLQNFLGGN